MNDFERIGRLERSYNELRAAVTKLETAVHAIKTDQVYLRDLMDARLKAIERAQELASAKMDALTTSIQSMASDAENTPAGRALQLQVTVLSSAVKTHETEIDKFGEWRSEFVGAFTLIRWLGVAGLTGLILTVLRMIRVLP